MDVSKAPLVKAIVIPTFVGSLLSCVASSAAIVLHIALPPKRHFRHALILNLLIADFINSLNNTISGAVVLANGHTLTGKSEATPACVVNAWIGQLSVQAVDFNILIISVVVLLTIHRTHLLSNATPRNTLLLCASAWIPGLITSTIGWALGTYGHVSGNWCWIRRDLLGMRYALTHAWRIAIFLATIVIYTVIYVRLTRVFGILRVDNTWSAKSTTFGSKFSRSQSGTRTRPRSRSRSRTLHDDEEDAQPLSGPSPPEDGGILVSQSFSVSHEPNDGLRPPTSSSSSSSPPGEYDADKLPPHEHHHIDMACTHELRPLPSAALRPEHRRQDASGKAHVLPGLRHERQHPQEGFTRASVVTASGSRPSPPRAAPPRHSVASVASVAKVPPPPNVRRMLLMNGYPIAYIVLWIPGMANRLVESVSGSSPRWLTALQASTQFVGFVNAVTYGYSEQMRQDLFMIWRGRRNFLRMRT